MHARQRIREAVASILSRNPVAWKSVVESRVASTRVIWPYLMVFVESETSQVGVVNDPCNYDRDLIISIVGMLRLPGTGDKESIEDRMDEVAAEIETKLTQDTLRAKVMVGSLEHISTSMAVIEGEGQDGQYTYHAEVTLSFRIGYSTEEGSPDSLI
jgi:hypothetical protein